MESDLGTSISKARTAGPKPTPEDREQLFIKQWEEANPGKSLMEACAEAAAKNRTALQEIAQAAIINPAIDMKLYAARINYELDKAQMADTKGFRHRIRAGEALIEARKNIEPSCWIEWCRANIMRSRQDIARVMKIAGDDDPVAAIEKERVANRVARIEKSNVTSMLHAASTAGPIIEAQFSVIEADLVEEALALFRRMDADQRARLIALQNDEAVVPSLA
jgi:hypothetical protein